MTTSALVTRRMRPLVLVLKYIRFLRGCSVRRFERRHVRATMRTILRPSGCSRERLRQFRRGCDGDGDVGGRIRRRFREFKLEGGTKAIYPKAELNTKASRFCRLNTIVSEYSSSSYRKSNHHFRFDPQRIDKVN